MHSRPESTTPTIGAPLGASQALGSGAVATTTGADPVVHADVLAGLVKTIRPHQWVKNLFVLAPIVFSKDVLLHTSQGPALNLLVTGRALAATGVFCLLAGAVYTMNDLADVAADRIHPVKRDRPIASGLVPEGIARGAAATLVAVSLSAAYFIAPAFALVALVYFAENVAYSMKLKRVAFLDVALLSFGFVLRVLGGGIAADVRVSAYMIACTALLALFLGFGKRRHELSLDNASKQRAALDVYTPRSLNVALAITGFATLATYVAYTLDPATRAFFNSNYLWLTTPFTAYGIARFLRLVRGQAGRGLKAESPTQEMLRDVPFVLNLVLWIAVVIAVVYHLRPN